MNRMITVHSTPENEPIKMWKINDKLKFQSELHQGLLG